MSLHQIVANVRNLRKDMDLLLDSQESHFDDAEDIGSDLQELDSEMGETKDGILESTEKNSNAVRAQTDRIVGAANAATSAGYGHLQVTGIVLGIGASIVYTKLHPKYEEWKQQSAAPPEKEQLANPPQQPAHNLTQQPVHKGVRAIE